MLLTRGCSPFLSVCSVRAYFLCCVARGDRDMRMLITVTDGLGPPLALAESKLIFLERG